MNDIEQINNKSYYSKIALKTFIIMLKVRMDIEAVNLL